MWFILYMCVRLSQNFFSAEGGGIGANGTKAFVIKKKNAILHTSPYASTAFTTETAGKVGCCAGISAIHAPYACAVKGKASAGNTRKTLMLYTFVYGQFLC